MWKSECTNGKKTRQVWHSRKFNTSFSNWPGAQGLFLPHLYPQSQLDPSTKIMANQPKPSNVPPLRNKGLIKPFQGKPMVDPTQKHPPTKTPPVPSSCAYASSPGSAVWKRKLVGLGLCSRSYICYMFAYLEGAIVCGIYTWSSRTLPCCWNFHGNNVWVYLPHH